MSQVEGRRRSGRESIEIKDLRNFVVVAEELNVTRAAARLGMQQSPLSRSLKSLQAELGVRLVDTTGNRLSLTSEGHRLVDDAKRILQQVGNLYPQARAVGEREHIRLGFSYSAGGHLPSLLDRCRDHTPHRSVSVLSTSASNMGPADFDVLIAPERQDVAGVAALPLWEEDLWVAVPAGHSVSGLSSPLLSELGQIGEIYYPSDLGMALGSVPRKTRLIEVPYLDTAFVESLMRSGQCTAILPGSLCKPLEQAGVSLKPVADLKPVSICAHTVRANDRGLGSWLAGLA